MSMTVRITFSESSPWPRKTMTLKNITEIHYNYPSAGQGKRIAFESDIDTTGYTYDVADIAEFEATA